MKHVCKPATIYIKSLIRHTIIIEITNNIQFMQNYNNMLHYSIIIRLIVVDIDFVEDFVGLFEDDHGREDLDLEI